MSNFCPYCGTPTAGQPCQCPGAVQARQQAGPPQTPPLQWSAPPSPTSPPPPNVPPAAAWQQPSQPSQPWQPAPLQGQYPQQGQPYAPPQGYAPYPPGQAAPPRPSAAGLAFKGLGDAFSRFFRSPAKSAAASSEISAGSALLLIGVETLLLFLLLLCMTGFRLPAGAIALLFLCSVLHAGIYFGLGLGLVKAFNRGVGARAVLGAHAAASVIWSCAYVAMAILNFIPLIGMFLNLILIAGVTAMGLLLYDIALRPSAPDDQKRILGVSIATGLSFALFLLLTILVVGLRMLSGVLRL